MFLRKYYYLDEDFINDSYSTIFGYDLTEQTITQINENSKGGKIGLDKVVVAQVAGDNKSNDTIKFSANKTPSAKLQAILDYINYENGESIPYYEQLDESTFSLINREDLFEGVFDLKFTKIEQYSQLANVASNFNNVFGLNLINDENKDAIVGIQSLAEKERNNGLTVIMHFINDKKYPCYCRLDEKYLKVDRSSINGELTVVCKVSRVIPKGKTVNLTDLTELTKLKLPNTNTRQGRTQQVKNIKSGQKNSTKEFTDEIKGPALEIIPIAIYK
jgi:hypothetical protein